MGKHRLRGLSRQVVALEVPSASRLETPGHRATPDCGGYGTTGPHSLLERDCKCWALLVKDSGLIGSSCCENGCRVGRSLVML